ncbi:hypothetical protein [Rhodoferax sp. WC2427]|uniref:hypothetical protein n=1 Tax=Rhodoferax sp. WC2427 TaxID=3234144 RepID=UPI003466939B
MEKRKVFMSVGSNGTPQQVAATDQIFSVVQASGLSPRQMEKNEWTAEQPLRGIRKVIEECQGAVVVAFTRYDFPSGTEYQKNGVQAPLLNARFPTVWNQIEAALAYGRDLPLLVVCEHGLRDDGLLEGRYDWKVFWTDFSPADLASDKFSGYVASWKKLVDERASANGTATESKDVDLAKVPITRLLGMLNTPQIVTVVGTLGSLGAAIAAGAYKMGGGHWPWP